MHLATREQVAHLAHAVQQDVVHDVEGLGAAVHCLVEVGLEADAHAVDDPSTQPIVERQFGERTGADRRRGRPLEEPEQHRQRVVVVASPVVDEVEADPSGLLVDARERQDLRGVHDRRVEAGPGALVQVDAVEHLAGGGVQSERDVGEPEDRAHARQLGLDAPDRLDRLDAVAARLDHARRERQGQGVDEDVRGAQSVARHREVGDVPRRADLPVRGAGLTLFVDARRHDRRAELGREAEKAVEARARSVALFEVDRVEDGLAAEPGQRLACDGGLGRVHHDGYRRLGGEAAHDLVHVTDAVGAGVVDADVEDVRALLDLVAADAHARVPVALEHRFTELLGAVGIGALPDEQHRPVLLVRRGRVDRRHGRLEDRCALGRRERTDRLDDAREVFGRGATAAADHLHAVLGDESGEVLGERVGREVVVHLAVDDARQAGVGQAGDRHGRGLAQLTQRLVHLDGSRRAVEPDDVDAQRTERRDRGPDLGAGQHASGQLDGDLGLDRHDASVPDHGAVTGGDGGLAREQVEHRLDDQQVDAALQESVGQLLVARREVVVGDLAERGELGAGSH